MLQHRFGLIWCPGPCLGSCHPAPFLDMSIQTWVAESVVASNYAVYYMSKAIMEWSEVSATGTPLLVVSASAEVANEVHVSLLWRSDHCDVLGSHKHPHPTRKRGGSQWYEPSDVLLQGFEITSTHSLCKLFQRSIAQEPIWALFLSTYRCTRRRVRPSRLTSLKYMP